LDGSQKYTVMSSSSISSLDMRNQQHGSNQGGRLDGEQRQLLQQQQQEEQIYDEQQQQQQPRNRNEDGFTSIVLPGMTDPSSYGHTNETTNNPRVGSVTLPPIIMGEKVRHQPQEMDSGPFSGGNNHHHHTHHNKNNNHQRKRAGTYIFAQNEFNASNFYGIDDDDDDDNADDNDDDDDNADDNDMTWGLGKPDGFSTNNNRRCAKGTTTMETEESETIGQLQSNQHLQPRAFELPSFSSRVIDHDGLQEQPPQHQRQSTMQRSVVVVGEEEEDHRRARPAQDNSNTSDNDDRDDGPKSFRLALPHPAVTTHHAPRGGDMTAPLGSSTVSGMQLLALFGAIMPNDSPTTAPPAKTTSTTKAVTDTPQGQGIHEMDEPRSSSPTRISSSCSRRRSTSHPRLTPAPSVHDSPVGGAKIEKEGFYLAPASSSSSSSSSEGEDDDDDESNPGKGASET
jgi:hypothetical protein